MFFKITNFCECGFNYSFVIEVLNEEFLEHLKNTHQKCLCGLIMGLKVDEIKTSFWDIYRPDRFSLALLFLNEETIFLSPNLIRFDLSELRKAGFSGEIKILDGGELISSIKINNLHKSFLKEYKNRRTRRIFLTGPSTESVSEIREETR